MVGIAMLVLRNLLCTAAAGLLLTACPRRESLAEEGRKLYIEGCTCHGDDGRSAQGVSFADPAFQRSRTDAELRTAIVKGKGQAMPAFGAQYDDHQLDALIAALRAFAR